jgi:hypothetical protein
MLAAGALVGADLTLLGWSAHYVLSHKHALGFWGGAGCASSILLAAVCGAAAASLMGASEKK